ncbi:MAG: hypothetical protein U0136_13460 [Bdellovibrionota bacterium]
MFDRSHLMRLAAGIQAYKEHHTLSTREVLDVVRDEIKFEDLHESLKIACEAARSITTTQVAMLCDYVHNLLQNIVSEIQDRLDSSSRSGNGDLLPVFMVRSYTRSDGWDALMSLAEPEEREQCQVVMPYYERLILELLRSGLPPEILLQPNGLGNKMAIFMMVTKPFILIEGTGLKLGFTDFMRQAIRRAVGGHEPETTDEELDESSLFATVFEAAADRTHVPVIPSYASGLRLWRSLFDRAFRENTVAKLETQREIAVAYLEAAILDRKFPDVVLKNKRLCWNLIEQEMADCKGQLAERERRLQKFAAAGCSLVVASEQTDVLRYRTLLSILTEHRHWLLRFLTS